MYKFFLFLTLSGIFLGACGNGDKVSTITERGSSVPANFGQVLDLTAQGFPFKIKTPTDAKAVSKSGIIQEMNIEGTGYFVQITASDALTQDRTALKTELLTELKNKPEFSKIILEEPFGFVYETKWTDKTIGYNFYYVLIINGKQYDIRGLNISKYDQAQTQAMYASVKQE
jgi:hypothetical protein